MRRTLLLCVLMLVGCAKSNPPAETPPAVETAAPAAISLADAAGTWDGTVTAAGNDTALTTSELVATVDPSGWTLKITNAKDPSKSTQAPATSVVAAGDSIVVDAGPFESVLRSGQQVSTRTVYRMEDGKLVGAIQATYPASGDVVMLHSVMTRRAQ